MDYVDIKKEKLHFKNLIQAPAPVGRVLNYVKMIGSGTLKHKKGNRNLNLTNNIGSSWTTEFMYGLDIAKYDIIPNKDVFPLYLTDKGMKLYELIKTAPYFDEDSNPEVCKNQLLKYEGAYELLDYIFKVSAPCRNLIAYLFNNKKTIYPTKQFRNEYYGFFLKHYENEDYNPASKTASTGENLVPSLIQFCKMFDCVVEEKRMYKFNYAELTKFNDDFEFEEIDEEKLEELEKEEIEIDKTVDELIEKYGIDGNTARKVVGRNSSVQRLFRNNLFAKYGCKCFICNKNIESILIASHIKASSESNVIEKVCPENGLVLCALHDKLFDNYLISFDFKTGELMWDSCLEGKLEEYQLNADLKLDEKYMLEDRKKFLEIHNKKFKGDNNE